MSRLYGACRYAYNWTLDQRELMRRRHGRMQSYTQLSGMFTQWKTNPGMEWLLAVSSTPLQQSIRHADVAYRNFLRLYKAGRTHIVTNHRTGKRHRTGLPRYKSRRDGEQSAEFTKSARFKVGHADGCKWGFLTLPKIGRVKLRWTRELPSTPNTVNIMLHADGSYEASFTVQVDDESDAPRPLHEACGIDMGLDSLMSIVYTDGTREKIPHPRTLKRKARRLRRLDKQLAREKKGSANHAKTRILKAKTYGRIRNQRRDMAYKLASKVAGENQAVALETLNVKGLARTPAWRRACWMRTGRVSSTASDNWASNTAEPSNASTGGIPAARSAPYAGIAMAGNRSTCASGNALSAVPCSTVTGTRP